MSYKRTPDICKKNSESNLNSKLLDGHHKVKCECNQCHKIIDKYPSALKKSKSGLVFCNKECRALYETKPKTIYKCANCGKKVKRSPTRLKYSKNGLVFCNKHCSQQYKWKDPDYMLMMSNNIKKCWEDDDYRNIITESARKTMKKRRSDPEEVKKMDEQLRLLNERQWSDSDFRKMMKEVSAKNWENPDFYQMQVNKMKKLWEDPDFYKSQVDKMNRLWKDEDFSINIRKLASNMMKERWMNEEYAIMKSIQMRNMMTNLWGTESHRQFMRESSLYRWTDYNYRLKICESRLNGFLPQNVIYKDYILENDIRLSPENKKWIDVARAQTKNTDFFTGECGVIEVHHLFEFRDIINIYDIQNMEDARNCKLLWDDDNALPMLEKYHKPLFNKLLKEKYGDVIKKSDFTQEMKEYVKNTIYPKIIENYK